MKSISRDEGWKEKEKGKEEEKRWGFAVDDRRKQNEHVNNVGNFVPYENQVLKLGGGEEQRMRERKPK